LVIHIENLVAYFGSLNNPQANFSKSSAGTLSECALTSQNTVLVHLASAHSLLKTQCWYT